MPKQNKGAGLGNPSPPRQGEKGGKDGRINKRGESATGSIPKESKAGKGAGTKGGGISGGKLANSPIRDRGKSNPEGKGSGNR